MYPLRESLWTRLTNCSSFCTAPPRAVARSVSDLHHRPGFGLKLARDAADLNDSPGERGCTAEPVRRGVHKLGAADVELWGSRIRRWRAKEPAVQGVRNEHPDHDDAVERDDRADDDGSSHEDQEAGEGLRAKAPRCLIVFGRQAGLARSAVRPRWLGHL